MMNTMKAKRRRVTKTDTPEDAVAINRRNRMRLINAYNDLAYIRFYDRLGFEKRIGKVKSVTERGLLLEFRGGYVESFFYEELIELETNRRIEGIK